MYVLQQRLVQFIQLSDEDNDTFFQRMLWIPVAFLIGAIIYFSVRQEPSFWIWCFLLTGLGGFFALVRLIPQAMRSLPEFLILLLVFAVLGGCYSAFRTHSMPSQPIKEDLDRVMVEGWLQSVSGVNERDRYLVRVHSISGRRPDELPEYVRLSLRAKEAMQSGRFIRCFAGLRPPPSASLPGDYNFAQQAYFSGLGAVGFVYGQCTPGRLAENDEPMARWSEQINAQRRVLAERISREAQGTGGEGLAAAVLTGDRSFLSPEDQETLQATGLAHLLAISGLHIGLAAGIFYFLLLRLFVLIEPLAIRFPVQKLAQFGALVAITFYLIFSGASISTQRAYVMLSVALVFGLFDRPVVSFQALTLSMFIVILIAPNAVMTPGFQMSFAATAALIGAYRLQAVKRKPQMVRGWFGKVQTFLSGIVVTSWVAGLATMPFAIYHFDRAAPLGFFANLIVMPIVTIVSVPLGAATAIALPFGMEAVPLHLFSESLGLVIDVARLFEVEGGLGQIIDVGRLSVLSASCFTAALLIWIVRRDRSRLLMSCCLIAGATTWLFQAKPFAYYDANGFLFARTQSGWIELDTDAKGLRPLRFSEAPSMSCKSECEVETVSEGVLAVTSGDNGLSLSMEQHTLLIDREDYPNGFALIRAGNIVRLMPLPASSCRPWSTAWPVCKVPS